MKVTPASLMLRSKTQSGWGAEFQERCTNEGLVPSPRLRKYLMELFLA